MTRLSPAARPFGKRAALLGIELSVEEAGQWDLSEDLKLFAITWLGGLVFFGTLIV